MHLIRTIAIALSVLLVATALPACTSDTTKAALAISKFRTMCPTELKNQFTGDAALASLGDTILTGITDETCSCITTRLRALPPEKVVELDRNGATTSSKEIEALVTPCAALAMKPHIEDMCMAGVKQAGGDANLLRPRCACVQDKVDAMDDATVEQTFANVGAGFGKVAESCMTAR